MNWFKRLFKNIFGEKEPRWCLESVGYKEFYRDKHGHVHLYTLRSEDPRRLYGHHPPSGANTKVYINDESIGNIQGISFGPGEDGKDQIEGTCIFTLFDGDDHIRWLGKEVHIALVTANEYGKSCTLYNAKVKFDDYENLGVSIDDIIIEVSLGFSLIERYFVDYVMPEENKRGS